MASPGGIEEESEEGQHEPIRRGRQLGRYVLCYELASGGMATVYLGRAAGAAGFEKLVALKIIHPHLAKEQEFIEMFLDEARLAARIDHPNVCSVFDFGEADGTYFLAMEYLVGENAARLARAIAKRPEARDDPQVPVLMAHIIQLACEGLHAAHEVVGDDGTSLEIVHRDMTPQNIFVGYDGSVRVVDFGVASAVGRVHQTTTGTLKGKYPYMSPEQIRQEKIDRRSDVWALGVTLWELVTRRRLFRRAGEYETLQAVLELEIPPPSALAPDLPAELDAIVMRALERDRDKRYPSARAFGRELGRFVSKSGGATTADLADMMESLFREERLKRNVLLDKARRMDPELPSTSKVQRAPLLSQDVSASTSMPSPVVASEPPPRKRPWLLVGGGLALAVALAAGTIVALSMDDGDGPSTVVADTDPAALEPPVAAGAGEVAETPDVETPEPDPAQLATPEPETPEPETPEPETPEPETPEPAQAASSHGTSSRSGRSHRSESAAQPTGEGRLAVVTPPGWAEIFADGQRVGRSPAELRLSSGSHRIRLLPYGEEPAINRTVEVEAGATARLVVRLEN